MLNALKVFKTNYDPVNFHLIYSLKATIAVAISSFLGYMLFGITGAILATNISMGIFFLANIEGNDRDRVKFISLYIILSCVFIPFVEPLISLGVWLGLIVFFWVFCIGISLMYNENLHKILLATNITGFAGLIAYANSSINITDSFGGLLIGGVVAGVIRVGSFVKYGSFTIKSITILISEILNLANHLDDENFEKFYEMSLERIGEFKDLFSNESLNIKDTSLIKNQARAIFYIYKIEEIAFLLNSVALLYTKIDDKELLYELKHEIKTNITELLNIFNGKNLEFKTEILHKLECSEYKILFSSVRAVYERFWLIKDGNDNKIKLKNKAKMHFKQIFSNINLSNQITLNSLRLAICMSIAVIISQIWHISHGLWIALAVMSMSRNSRYLLKNASRDNLIGGIFGFFMGIVAIFLFEKSPIIHILAGFGMFFIFYFKAYKQIVFTAVFMAEFSVMYSFIRSDFLELLAYRIIDILIGFSVVFVVSLMTLPKDKGEFVINFKKIINHYKLFFENMQQKNFIKTQKNIAQDLGEYKELLKNVKLKNIVEIYKILNEMNASVVNFKAYIDRNAFENSIELQTDLNMIKSRFEMLNKKIDGLPYYFIENIENKLSYSDDKKLVYLLNLIAKKQNELYSLISL